MSSRFRRLRSKWSAASDNTQNTSYHRGSLLFISTASKGFSSFGLRGGILFWTRLECRVNHTLRCQKKRSRSVEKPTSGGERRIEPITRSVSGCGNTSDEAYYPNPLFQTSSLVFLKGDRATADCAGSLRIHSSHFLIARVAWGMTTIEDKTRSRLVTNRTFRFHSLRLCGRLCDGLCGRLCGIRCDRWSKNELVS